MRRIVTVLALGCALASCGRRVSPEARRLADDKAIAEVEANQTPPPETPELQPVTSQDIDALGLLAGGCSFYAKGTSDQILALWQPDAAYLKIDGEIERLASDNGSRSGPMDTRARYDGKRRSLQIVLGAKGISIVSDTLDYPARLIQRDGRGRTEQTLDGIARCGG